MGESLDLAELDALANVPLAVTVGGRARYTVDGVREEIPRRTLTVTPIEVAELPAMLRACETIFAELAGGDIAQALLHNPDAAIVAITVGARLTRAEVDALANDELIELGGAVLQVNADFFARRLAPAFVAASERVTRAMAGSTPLPGWSAQGSPEAM